MSSWPTELLTMQEAREFLRVSASTLRRWSDGGLVRCSKTVGGHRRYEMGALEGFAGKLAGTVVRAATAAQGFVPFSEWHIPEERLSIQPWHARLASPETEDAMRALGQRILGLLIQYIARPQDDSRFLQEAQESGASYGVLAVRCGASFRESVEAFIFFRKAFSRTALQMPRVAQSSDAEEAIRLAEQINQFMDVVLIGLVAGYETGRANEPVSKAMR